MPFDFPTGSGMVYNNSAYFLMGIIIEKVAGMSYGDFVAKRFFEPLGMRDSHYCNERKIVKNRAHGYDMGPGGQLVLKAYLDHTYPYAAGSLCSTAADLLTWLQALHGGRVLPDREYRSRSRRNTLNDGARCATQGVARLRRRASGERERRRHNGYSETVGMPENSSCCGALIRPGRFSRFGPIHVTLCSAGPTPVLTTAPTSTPTGPYKGPPRRSAFRHFRRRQRHPVRGCQAPAPALGRGNDRSLAA